MPAPLPSSGRPRAHGTGDEHPRERARAGVEAPTPRHSGATEIRSVAGQWIPSHLSNGLSSEVVSHLL